MIYILKAVIIAVSVNFKPILISNVQASCIISRDKLTSTCQVLVKQDAVSMGNIFWWHMYERTRHPYQGQKGIIRLKNCSLSASIGSKHQSSLILKEGVKLLCCGSVSFQAVAFLPEQYYVSIGGNYWQLQQERAQRISGTTESPPPPTHPPHTSWYCSLY